MQETLKLTYRHRCASIILQLEIRPSDSLPHEVQFGCTLRTFNINVPVYMSRLHRLFLSLGGHVVQKKLGSIAGVPHLLNGEGVPSPPGLIIVAAGLGARELLNDDTVYPVRGQTVLVRAPQRMTEKKDFCLTGISKVNKEGFRDMYIIPRGDGTVILGGTRIANDWDTEPREETTRQIIEQALKWMPLLGNKDSKDRVDIIDVNVGLRPARKDGELLEYGESIAQTPVITSYGYGGYGYQCSWGAALETRDMVDKHFNRPVLPWSDSLPSLDIF